MQLERSALKRNTRMNSSFLCSAAASRAAQSCLQAALGGLCRHVKPPGKAAAARIGCPTLVYTSTHRAKMAPKTAEIPVGRNKIMRIRRVGLLLALAITALSQNVTSSIVGNVRDASGASIPGASVIVTNEGTGIETKTKTGAD